MDQSDTRWLADPAHVAIPTGLVPCNQQVERRRAPTRAASTRAISTFVLPNVDRYTSEGQSSKNGLEGCQLLSRTLLGKNADENPYVYVSLGLRICARIK